MADYTNVLKRTAALEYGPAFEPYTGVKLWYDDENGYFAGDETGRVLEADCPWATQAMADNILQNIKGFVYQPFEAEDALIDPAAELGDGVGIGGIYGVLASSSITLDSLCAADIGAPENDELDYEFPYLSPTQRALKRKVTLGESYYGTRITRANGLENIRIDAEGNEAARAVFNADELAFYAGSERALYFDIETKRYMYVGDIYVKGNINMSEGTITWGKNNPADGSGISASEARTIISEELVRSPNIAGGKFLDIVQTTWIEMATPNSNVAYLHQYADIYSDSDPVCAMGYYNTGSADEWVLAPFNKIRLGYSDTYDLMYCNGNWDFSNADVTGLHLRFS